MFLWKVVAAARTILGVRPHRRAKKPLSPRQTFGGVFDVVQLSHTFSDSKTFVDAVPRQRQARIIKDYQKQYGAQLDLRRFVKDHFVLPEPVEAPKGSEGSNVPVRQYIDTMWDVLTRPADSALARSSLLPLPFPYVVPGGRFREIYYWDSYFTMLGLRESGRADLVESMVKNAAHLVETYGFIPNGNRTYYLTRSQPPVFALMVELLAEIKGEHVYVTYLKTLRQEYDFWMRGEKSASFVNKTVPAAEHVVRMPDGSLLNRFWDSAISPREESFIEDIEVGKTLDSSADFYRNMRAGAASGWDYSSRWFADMSDRTSIMTTNIVPIDLNVFLLRTEEILSRAYQLDAKPRRANLFDQKAQTRREVMQRYLWDEASGWYYDFFMAESKKSTQVTAAGMFALYGGVATSEQAQKMRAVAETKLLQQGGLATTLVSSGEQWDAPNGWAPLQYIAVMGLDRYGEHDLAETIATRWCRTNISLYEKTGYLFEKYNIETLENVATGGEYSVQTGFGWTNGVLLTLMNKYHL